MTATIIIPAKLKEKLEDLERKKDTTLEELIVTTLDEKFSLLNPEDKTEIHLELSEKYLSDAEELLRKKESVQASEKGWGAASQILKAMAAKEGKELRSHRELWEYASGLRIRYGDEELGVFWREANTLHMNFYEDWMPLEEVELTVRDVKRFVEKLRGLMKG
jgi:hypothetical protein